MDKIFTNRIGHDDFVWWIGVIEDRDDPLKLGRCKVRIFGSHTEDLARIPTSSLPWAAPLYPVNNSKSYTSPMEGDYVFGFFMDGRACQAPTMLGVFTGIPQEEPRPGIGFSAISRIQNNAEVQARVEDVTPVVPGNAPAMKLQRTGSPTIPANAYTTSNTMLSVTNSNLLHGCDFRFLIVLDQLNIGVIENPFTLIEESIKNAKNKAAALIRVLLSKLLETFRLTFQGAIIALNLDPTGELSKAFSKVREIVRTVNYYSRKLAEYVGEIALVVALVDELRKIVEWIQSLPEKIIALLRDCLTTFRSAIDKATSDIVAIPGTVSTGLVAAFQDLKSQTDAAISTAQQEIVAANVSNTLIEIVSSPQTSNANTIISYINSEYPNTNVVIQNSSSSTYNIANASTP